MATLTASPLASSFPVAVAINSFVSLHRRQLADGPMGAALISVAVTIALTRGRTPVLWTGVFHRTGNGTSSGRGKSKASDLQRGSRSSKKLLASSQTQALSHGWRNEAYKPQLSAAEVYDTGTGLLVA